MKKRVLALAPVALAAVALAAAPAAAKTKKHHRAHHGATYEQPYAEYSQGGWNNGWGWNSRSVSDPSYTSPNYRRDQSLGRCVEDLGYGRYEYCDW